MRHRPSRRCPLSKAAATITADNHLRALKLNHNRRWRHRRFRYVWELGQDVVGSSALGATRKQTFLAAIVDKLRTWLYEIAKTVSELLVKYGWKIGTDDEAMLDDKQWRTCLVQYIATLLTFVCNVVFTVVFHDMSLLIDFVSEVILSSVGYEHQNKYPTDFS